MRAGVAKICITPPVGTWQGGYGARTHPCVGIHDDLFARAVVFEGGDRPEERAAIVSVDISGLQADAADEARRRAETMTGIPAGNIALCTSHTHGGPVTRGFVGRDQGPQVDDAYLGILAKLLAGTVAAAARETRPVALHLGRSQAGFNVNRRLPTPDGIVMRPHPDGLVDREVLALRVDETFGTTRTPGEIWPSRPPLAVLFRYTCHATAMGAQNYLITADYPGAAAAEVERSYGGQTLALFMQGCAGNIRPNLTTPEGGFRSATWPELERLGRELGGATVAAAEQAAFGAHRNLPAPGEGDIQGGVAVAGTTTTLPYAQRPSADELRQLLEANHWPEGRSLSETERQWATAAARALSRGDVDPGVPAEVQVFRLGSVWLVTLPGEVFLEIGYKTRDAVARAAGVSPDRVVVAAYANGSVGYVPTGAAMPEGGYEVTAYRHGGRLFGFAPEAEEVLAGTAASLAASLRQAVRP